MMPTFLFPGLNLALAVPFDASGAVDLDRLERNIDRYLEAGVKGFVLSSGTGMHVYLSREESDAVAARAMLALKGRAKTIVQTSALRIEDVVARTRHAADLGADGVMVLPPFFEGPTDDEALLDFYATVAECGLPVIGYNVPQATGVDISPELLVALTDVPNFLGVKDSSGDLVRQADLIRTGRPVMNGADPLMPHSLFAGVPGLIWGGANFAPRTCLRLVEAAQAERWNDVRELWKTLQPSMSLIWQGDYVSSVYAASALAGYDAGEPRRPLRALSPARQDVLRAAIADLHSREQAI